MWFKQLQLFELTGPESITASQLEEKLEPLAFTSCLPSLPSSIGWVAPIDVENAPLVHTVNGYILFCLQIEEKILPATVIRQELQEKVKMIEITEDRRVRSKEKLTIKEELTMTLLPRAFSKFTRLYAYIDTKNKWLVLGTTNASKTEQFISLYKRCVNENIRLCELKKLSPLMTHCLKTQNYPKEFSIEKSCVLQDPQQQKRVIRCQQQNLFAGSIQELIKDGCEVKQLAMCWQDRVNFVFTDDFTVRGIQYQDEILSQAKDIESETREQQLDADFFIMTETLHGLIKDLMNMFTIPADAKLQNDQDLVA
ncbi:MAG: recombination-associated protein RdgC [Gammaproteobacteria bacterium]|nr:recombination-associated protein RdgC [Gammaproteobacteria bacterium]